MDLAVKVRFFSNLSLVCVQENVELENQKWNKAKKTSIDDIYLLQHKWQEARSQGFLVFNLEETANASNRMH